MREASINELRMELKLLSTSPEREFSRRLPGFRRTDDGNEWS